MRCTLATLTLLFLVSLFFSSPAALQNPQKTPPKPVYKATGSEATLMGSILVDGEVPKSLLFDMSLDKVCEEINEPRARTEDLLVENRAVRNAFVYVKSGGDLDAYRFEVPQTEVTVEFKKCLISPHVLALRAGQSWTLINRDPTVHKPHPRPKINPEWYQTLPPGSAPFSKAFFRPEQFMAVRCDQHPWESAIVGVFAHPFFATSDQFGNYEIRGLPPGTYKLGVWHERLGEKEMEVTVSGESRKIDFTFAAPKSRFSQ